jgi:hypothetical protein
MTKYDQRSADPILFLVEGSAGPVDYSANALARLAWVRDQSLDPHNVPAKAIDAVIADLVASGRYSDKPPA